MRLSTILAIVLRRKPIGTAALGAALVLSVIIAGAARAGTAGGGAPDGAAFARGDADCDFGRAAADVVAHTLALGGVSRCGNDDCTRDGEITDDDRSCAAGCLFDACPAPDHAPRVSAVVPASAATITPLSLVRVQGSGFARTDRLTTVIIGGAAARVIETAGPDELLVAVPNLPAGPADVVVLAGDLAGAPFPIQVSAAAAGGAAGVPTSGGIAELLALLDEIAMRFLALDLTVFYDVENIPLVREAVEGFRGALAELDVDGLLSTQERAAIDLLINGSGVLDLARAVIADLTMLGQSGGAHQTTATVAGVTRLAGYGMAVTRIATVGTPLASLAAAATIKAVLVGAAVVGLAKGADALLSPVITRIDFRDANDGARALPTAFGTAQVRGARLDLDSTKLVTKTAYLRRVLNPIGECGAGCLEYSLPDVSGFCGSVAFHLEDGVFDSDAIGTNVQPEVRNVAPSKAMLTTPLILGVRGVAPGFDACKVDVFFAGPQPDQRSYPAFDAAPALYQGDPHALFITPQTFIGTRTFNLELPPGEHIAQVQVGGERSQEDVAFEYTSRIAGIGVECDVTELALPPALPSAAACCFEPLNADGVPLLNYPVNTRIEVRIAGDAVEADPAFIDADVDGETRFCGFDPMATMNADNIGQAAISAEAFSANRFLARSATAVTLTVRDRTAPVVSITNLDCDDFIPVSPGATVNIIAIADDSQVVSRIRLTATGEAAANPQQEFPCVFEPTEPTTRCEARFPLSFRSAGFTEREVFAVVEAFDGAGNASLKRQCSFRVTGPLPTTAPTRPTPTALATATPVVRPPTLRRLVGRETTVPGRTERFVAFSSWNISNGVVVFVGQFRVGSNDAYGVYATDGDSVWPLVDGTTLVPGTASSRFRSPSNLLLDGEEVVFSSRDGLRIDQSVFQGDFYRTSIDATPLDNVERVIVGTDMRCAGGQTERCSSNPIYSLSLRRGLLGGTVSPAFVLLTSLPASRDTLQFLVDANTTVPGNGGRFTQVSSSMPLLEFADNTPIIVFQASASDRNGVYTVSPGQAPQRIADSTMAVPGGVGNFNGFCRTALDGDRVAFVAVLNFGGHGVYTNRDGSLAKVANPLTPVPGGTGTLADIGCSVGLDDGIIVFQNEQPHGVFADVGGGLTRVAAAGDRIDGKIVEQAFFFGDNTIDGREALVWLDFPGSDDDGMYIATFASER